MAKGQEAYVKLLYYTELSKSDVFSTFFVYDHEIQFRKSQYL